METENIKVDVIIPTYHPDEKLDKLIMRLNLQTRKPDSIIMINTRDDFDGKGRKRRINKKCSVNVRNYGCYANVKIIEIPKSEFDHAGTRNRAARASKADVMVFMTQDAVPASKYLIENLLAGFKDDEVAAVYARQTADPSSGMVEAFTRKFNYPCQDQKKSSKDLKKYGIKTYFCSNVCAAYRKDRFMEMNGFMEPAIFNEDMVMGAHLIERGYSIYYASHARVIHSHKYTAMQQFHRNFDIGASQKMNEDLFSGVKSEGEGIKLVLYTLAFLLSKKQYLLVPGLLWTSAWKYIGFFMGKHYNIFPMAWCKKFSLSPDFWDKNLR